MPEKKPISFDVPSEVKTASQSGWVHRSDAAPTPGVAAAPVSALVQAPEAATAVVPSVSASATVEALPVRAVKRAAPASPSWLDTAAEWLVLPFSLPLCHILALAPSTRRAKSSK